MTTLIVVLAIVAIIVVAVVALAVGFANGCKYGYLIGQEERVNGEREIGYENGYREALMDCNASLINWN